MYCDGPGRMALREWEKTTWVLVLHEVGLKSREQVSPPPEEGRKGDGRRTLSLAAGGFLKTKVVGFFCLASASSTSFPSSVLPVVDLFLALDLETEVWSLGLDGDTPSLSSGVVSSSKSGLEWCASSLAMLLAREGAVVLLDSSRTASKRGASILSWMELTRRLKNPVFLTKLLPVRSFS